MQEVDEYFGLQYPTVSPIVPRMKLSCELASGLLDREVSGVRDCKT